MDDRLLMIEICFCSQKDGSYLAEFLLAKGYKVHGIIRWVFFHLQDLMIELCQKKMFVCFFF